MSTQLQTGNTVDIVATGRQQNHRHLALRADAPKHFDSGHARHHDVEHNNVVTTGQRLDFPFFRTVGAGHSEAFTGQVLAEHFGQFPIIVDKQYASHGRPLIGGCRLSRRRCSMSARPDDLYLTLHRVNRPQHALPLCCAANSACRTGPFWRVIGSAQMPLSPLSGKGLMISSRLLLSFCLLFSVPLVHADTFSISDIRVNGLQRVSAGSVFAALPLNVGDQADEQRLADASRSLFKTGFFQDINVARDGNVLVINVVERPSIASIEIIGNKAISTDDLMKGLKQSGLSEGEIFQRATLEGVRNELQRQYVSQGRYSASVDTEALPAPRNRIALKITIDEGTVASIQHINVVGNTVFSDEELADQFQLKTSNWLSFFKNDDKYAREKLSGDLERLRSWYLDRGYINMDINSTQVSLTPDKKGVFITVNITEGQRYTVGSVKLGGDLKVPQDQLEQLILVKPGQVFSRKVMTDTTNLITRRLGNDGYTFANVNGVPKANEANHTVDISFVVDAGKRAYANRINFRGNTNRAAC
ncbi:OMP85 family outer membrane protein, partial [Pseudomonas amygdali pv. sesami]